MWVSSPSNPHPITPTVSLTFFPGIRPLSLTQPAAGVLATPILKSSRDSYARPVEAAESRRIEPTPPSHGSVPASPSPVGSVADVAPRVLGIAVEGTLAEGAPP